MTMIFRVMAGQMFCGKLYVHKNGLHSYVPFRCYETVQRNMGAIPDIIKRKQLNLNRIH